MNDKRTYAEDDIISLATRHRENACINNSAHRELPAGALNVDEARALCRLITEMYGEGIP